MSSEPNITLFIEAACNSYCHDIVIEISKAFILTSDLTCWTLTDLQDYLEIHSEDRSKADSTGSFIQFLLAGANQSTVSGQISTNERAAWPLFAFEVELRFDLGHLQAYIEADQYFQSLEK